MDLNKRVTELAAQAAEDEGLELIEANVFGTGPKRIVRVTIDKESGVTVGDCERMSRGFEALLDVEDLLPSSYMLEVSSPGLDRPLVKIQDFKKVVGKLVKVITSEKIGPDTTLRGRIIDTGDDWIRLRLEAKPEKGRPAKKPDEANDLFVPLDKITKAKLEIER